MRLLLLSLPCLCVCVLAACSPEQTKQVQQTASASIGVLHQTLKQASSPLAHLQKHASAALAVAPAEFKENISKLKQQASAGQALLRAVQQE